MVERGTLGIVHPVLPCGTKIFVAYGNRQAFTRVVDRGPVREGRAFDLTAALAAKLGVRGVRDVRWAFASR
jgi:rare lipoprotein A (peptidoglycan hydrolase)